jgi:HEAT repeat protein
MSGRKHRQPTFAECMKMMRRRDPQVNEDGFHALLGRPEHLDALVRELETETAHGLRCWLLELIGETRRPDAVPVLAEYLTSEDESFRYWAVAGLQRIDTKEARRLLWEAQQRHSQAHTDPSDTP